MFTHIDRKFRAALATEAGDGNGPAVKSAKVLPNGRAGSEPEVKVTEEQVTPAYRTLAQQQGAAAYALQFDKVDGIGVLADRLESKKGLAGDCVLRVIRAAVEQAGNDMRYAYGYAIVGLKIAEDTMKSKYKEDTNGLKEEPVSEICPTWSTYKSDCLKTLQKAATNPDLNPLRRDAGDAFVFSTAADYRKAGKDKPGADQGRGKRQEGTKDPTGKKLQLALVERGMHTDISVALGHLAAVFATFSTEEAPRAVEAIKAFSNSMATMHADWIKAHPAVAEATTGNAELDAEAAEALERDNAAETARQTAENGKPNPKRKRK